MRHIWVTVLVSGLIAAVLTTAAVLAPSTQDSPPAADAMVMTRGGAELAEHGEDDGLGPPPWARAGGRLGAPRGKTDKSWRDDWRALTPAQKTQKMAVLSREHDQGMLEWARCVRSAGADGAKRRDCEKPLPPGLARKQS